MTSQQEKKSKMGLIDRVKNFLTKVWTFLEKAVINDIKNTVSKGIEEVKDSTQNKVKSVKKRARNKLGRFIPDNPKEE